MGLSMHSVEIDDEGRPLHFELRNGVLCLWDMSESVFILRLSRQEAEKMRDQISDYLAIMAPDAPIDHEHAA